MLKLNNNNSINSKISNLKIEKEEIILSDQTDWPFRLLDVGETTAIYLSIVIDMSHDSKGSKLDLNLVKKQLTNLADSIFNVNKTIFVNIHG